MVSRPDGTVVFESRAEQGLSIDHVNLREKQRFMSGEKVRAASNTFCQLLGGEVGMPALLKTCLLSPWVPRVEQ